jgi:hypothetical protein
VKYYESDVAIVLAVQFIVLGVAVAPRLLRGAASTPNYSGTWVETKPQKGRALRLNLTQNGSQIEVRMSRTGTFSGNVFGVATIQSDNSATWTLRQDCAAEFRHAGYNYDNPGENLFTLRLSQPTGSDSSEPVFLYTEDTKWNVPCEGHPIGTEHVSAVLQHEQSAPANR